MAARTLLGLLLFLLYSRELECATVSNPLSGDDNGLQSHHLTGYSQQEFIANGTAQAGTAMIIYPFKVTLLDPEDDKHNAEGSQIIWILSVGVSLHSFIAALIVYLRWRKHNISLREEAREQGRQDPNEGIWWREVLLWTPSDTPQEAPAQAAPPTTEDRPTPSVMSRLSPVLASPASPQTPVQPTPHSPPSQTFTVAPEAASSLMTGSAVQRSQAGEIPPGLMATTALSAGRSLGGLSAAMQRPPSSGAGRPGSPSNGAGAWSSGGMAIPGYTPWMSTSSSQQPAPARLPFSMNRVPFSHGTLEVTRLQSQASIARALASLARNVQVHNRSMPTMPNPAPGLPTEQRIMAPEMRCMNLTDVDRPGMQPSRLRESADHNASPAGTSADSTSVDLMEFDSACQHHIMTALGMMGPAPDAAPASWESEAAVREPSIAAESEVGTQAAGIVGNPVERTGSTTAEDIRVRPSSTGEQQPLESGSGGARQDPGMLRRGGEAGPGPSSLAHPDRLMGQGSPHWHPPSTSTAGEQAHSTYPTFTLSRVVDVRKLPTRDCSTTGANDHTQQLAQSGLQL
ncbi:hypothetical protein CYMTET_44207 [Cymbomonas tetramitiformis]|uniref:Uncharacterized protein n=1 Tax=Cymbomonas tetramitiformis TaxID=36881 RepID=A0AAE0EZU4_9CHLO|nr:hypothetical protein CYMTET_44207 [Cymbomonas tetramitiformis]